jgi:hypothetical protein
VRRYDDYNGSASLLVIALRAPIPLPVLEARTSKACSRCGKVKDLADFGAEKQRRDNRRST